MTKVGARALLDKIEAFWLLHHKKHFEGRLEKQTLGGRLYWYVRFDGKDHPALT